MSSRRQSLRESLRMNTRDYSLVVVAVMFVIFGLAFSNNIIPNYHELQALEKHRAELKKEVEAAKADNDRLEDEIESLDDPYDQADILVREFHYRYAEPEADPTKDEK
jgi:cell division protein FtsB